MVTCKLYKTGTFILYLLIGNTHMNIVELNLKRFRAKNNLSFNSVIAANSSAALALASCGSSSESTKKGFPSSYVAPKSNYDPPNVSDPYAGILNSSYVNPYWVQALEMDQSDLHISPILEDYERVIHYSFPEIKPLYNHFNIIDWEPASASMKIATSDILSKN